jgi:hypothetical protein
MKDVQSNREFKLPLSALLVLNPFVYRSLNGQAKDKALHTSGRIIERSYRNNGRIKDAFREHHDHWSQICRCDFIRSISPARVCRSISSARSYSLHIVRPISSPARSLSSTHLISCLIYSPVQLRSTLGLGAHLILSPARLTASVSAHASVFSIPFSVSQPDHHTDARTSQCRVHLIYTALSPYLRTAF